MGGRVADQWWTNCPGLDGRLHGEPVSPQAGVRLRPGDPEDRRCSRLVTLGVLQGGENGVAAWRIQACGLVRGPGADFPRILCTSEPVERDLTQDYAARLCRPTTRRNDVWRAPNLADMPLDAVQAAFRIELSCCGTLESRAGGLPVVISRLRPCGENGTARRRPPIRQAS